MNHIDWKDMVKEYKEQYDNEYYISEFVEGLVPINYYEILKTFHDMTYEIKEHHIGLPLWKVMCECIYNEYYESFMGEWDGFDEEE